MTVKPDNRLPFLDALRGVAVVLMMEQHLMAWFWNQPWNNLVRLISEYPLIIGANGLGGLAAPLFLVCAGAGAVLMLERGGNGRTLISRGLMVLVTGYIMNLIIPTWFSPCSWYVLHVIGASLVLAPLLLRLPRPLIWGVLLVLLAVPLQHMLGTPSFQSNEDMARCPTFGRVLSLVVAEGHFPLVPWVGMFLFGVFAGRNLHQDWKRMLVPALVFLAIGILLGLAGAWLRLSPSSFTGRFLYPMPVFYPARPPVMFILSGSSLLLFALFRALAPRAGNILVHTGRISLTLLVLHAFLFKEVSQRLGTYKLLPAGQALLLTVAVILAAMAVARLWSRWNYRFGLEWFIRLPDPRKKKEEPH
jgi:uncharacterized membrane protein